MRVVGKTCATCILLFAAVRSRHGEKQELLAFGNVHFCPSLLVMCDILQGMALFEVAVQQDLVIYGIKA